MTTKPNKMTISIVDFEAGLDDDQAIEALKRWNCHEELLEALKELTGYVNARYGNHGPLKMWTKVQNAIAKAEEK